MSRKYNVAVVGCDTLVGESVLALLEEREFPLAGIHALAAEGGGRASFMGKYLRIETLADFDFSVVELAFFCVEEALAEQHAPRAAAAGCIVFDDSPCFRLEDDVPLVVAEVNPEAIAGYVTQKIIASPGSNAAMLTTVLKPLQAMLQISRINVVTLQAVSGRDRAGVEELARQTAALLNLKPIENEVFDQQIAFNMLPQIGAVLDDGYSREEKKLVWETQKILDDTNLSVQATCVRVPVFHGHAMVLHLESHTETDLDQIRNLLHRAPAIELIEDGDLPTPVMAVGQDAVFVARLCQDPRFPGALALWLVADNVRKGAALNSVQNAEILIKEYLG